MAAGRLGDAVREAHAAMVAVVAVVRDHEHVAEHGVVHPRVDLGHQVVAIDRRLGLELARLVDPEARILDLGLGGDRGLDDAVRRGPQVVLQRHRRRLHAVGHRVVDDPGAVARDAAGAPELAAMGHRGAAQLVGAHHRGVVAQRLARVVVSPAVFGQVHPRPGHARLVGLADAVAEPRAPDLDALRRAHGPGDVLQVGPGGRTEEQGRGARRRGRDGVFAHGLTPCWGPIPGPEVENDPAPPDHPSPGGEFDRPAPSARLAAQQSPGGTAWRSRCARSIRCSSAR